MSAAIPDNIVRQAAEWAALLDADASEREACESWCQQDPRHRVVFDRMRRFDASLQALDDAQRGVLRQSVSQPSRRRKLYGGALALAAIALTGLTMSVRDTEVSAIRFATQSEQREVVLDDASTLTLDARSTVRVRIGATQREVELDAGRVFANVAPDANRRFTVITHNATATALGTAYAVSTNATGTQVIVVESRVRVCTRASNACIDLRGGESIHITGDALSEIRAVDAHATTAWTRGWLEANDVPVTQVLRELAARLDTPLHVDADALRTVHVTGSYPLDRPHAALDALAESVGLHIAQHPDGGMRITLP